MKPMKESKNLEFKENITTTFLKTVSAFANYDGGEIIFGIDDKGTIIGLEKPEETALAIENSINDTIKPQPDYAIAINKKDHTVTIGVKSGQHQPYLYKNKAYKRNGTATIEVDDIEMRRLILSGEHLAFEQLKSKQQNLTFSSLENALKAQTGIMRFDQDVLKTLNLYSDESGYNNAAAILADKNSFAGIDIAKFGESINVIQKRKTEDHKSILDAYSAAVEMYRDYYQQEIVKGDKRIEEELIPEEAFREAVANAIIHREWDIQANIRVSMFDDHIEIVSPGSLPRGISKEEYYEGKFTMLRNPILANVFNRLKIVETFGTGVLRIKESYSGSISKPIFDAGENFISVTLPIIKVEVKLTQDEEIIYSVLSRSRAMSISEIMEAPEVTFGKSKATKLLKSLGEKNLVDVEGVGRGTKYRR